MQNTKNHEEEVKLRLKFEGKFNKILLEHRELQIRFERIQKEYKATQLRVSNFEDLTKQQADELAVLKKENTESKSLIEQLQEWKNMAERELKKKNISLMQAEQAKLQANENRDLAGYQVQESTKDLNDLKVKAEIKEQEIIRPGM